MNVNFLRNQCTSASSTGRNINVTASSPLWIHHLDNEGYAVVPNVLSPQQCDHVIDKAWEWMEALGTGIERGDPSTWTDDRWPQNFNGIIQRYRIGHAPFVWQARSNENVTRVFEEIWGTGELLTSFDAMCMLRPAELVEGIQKDYSYWFHTDQSPKKKGFHCVQGVLNLEEVSIDDATFACYPKSHKLHEELFERNKEDPGMDYYVLSEDDVAWAEGEKSLSHLRVVPQKGSFIAFDSRLLHCNLPAKFPRENPRWRHALYVCMTPRAWADRNTLRARVDAFKKQRMTTHWPHHVGLFPEDPADVTIPKFDVELNNVVKRLVVMQDYDGNEEVFDDIEDEADGRGFSPHDRPAL